MTHAPWPAAPAASSPSIPRSLRDHRAWLDYWGTELVKAVAYAVAEPAPGFWSEHAVRCARIAHSRAVKVRPSLKR